MRWRIDARALDCPPRCITHNMPLDRNKRSYCCEKDRFVVDPWAPICDVTKHCVSYVRWEGKPCFSSVLTKQSYRSLLPVDVAKLEPCHLARAKSQPCK